MFGKKDGEKKKPFEEEQFRLRTPKEASKMGVGVTPVHSVVDKRYQRKSGGRAYLDEEFRPEVDPPPSLKNVTLKSLDPCPPAHRSGDPRECQVEMLFIGPRYAKAISDANKGKKVETGAYMRVCVRPREPGHLIKVRDPLEARAFWKDYCGCVKMNRKDKDRPLRCLRVQEEISKAPFGRSRRKATRRR